MKILNLSRKGFLETNSPLRDASMLCSPKKMATIQKNGWKGFIWYSLYFICSIEFAASSITLYCTVILIELACKYFYSAAASGDPCTLYSDRNLVNRRNVTMPVDKSYASCKKLLVLEIETRVTCMPLQVLGMAKLSDTPTMNIPPKHNAPDILKKIYLGQVSNIIYELHK